MTTDEIARMATALDAFIDSSLGTDAIYTPADGGASTVLRVSFSVNEVKGWPDTAYEAVAVIKKSELATRPDYRGTLLINDTTWRIYQDYKTSAFISEDGNYWDVPLITDERPRLRKK